ncbi:Tensin/EPS8 phosphotyrosine-binding domain [Trinorchestia longiramus]|nr:Tensin/EPS8 phosphotyrosine-binding domain [Trinorchestia longiramus]
MSFVLVRSARPDVMTVTHPCRISVGSLLELVFDRVLVAAPKVYCTPQLPVGSGDISTREPVPHTLGPIDGSLYATVTKRRNNSSSETNINNIKNSSPGVQQFEHQQPPHHQSQELGSTFQYPVDHRIDLSSKSHQHHQHHPSSYSSLRQTPVRNQDHFGSLNINQQSRSTPHTPQHPSQQQRQPEQQHHGHHTPVATSQHLVHHQHHLSQHHHHHHIHHQGGSLPHHHQHQQYPGSSHPHTPAHTASHTLQHSTPSPHSTAYSNGRYAASIDSGFVGSIAPLSPPTSDCPVSSVSPSSAQQSNSAQQPPDHPHQQQQQRSQQVYRRFSDPNQLNMAPVAAVATRPVQSSSGGSSRVDARQLDELLAGMLLDIENIPDLRPGQTPAPDINSIRCPDLSWSSSTRGRSSSSRSGPTMSPVNGYGGSHHHGGSVSNHDSLLDTSLTLSGGGEDSASAPYHTRLDSRPFSYGAVTSSPVLSRHRSPSPNSSPNRRTSREPIISRSGLESPRLVRRMSGSVGAVAGNTTTDSGAVMSGVNTSVLGNGTTNTTRRSPSPSPEPGSRGSTLRRERSQTLTNRIMAGEPSPPTTLTRSHVTRSASRLDDPDTIFAPDTLSRSLSGTSSSWLATQQRKLVERREATRRADRGKHEARVMSELRSRIGQHYNRTNTAPTYSGTSRYGRYGDFEDGYVSDTTLFSDTSRESSPTKHYPYSPLSISTGDPYNFNRDHYSSINRRIPNARENSAPSSPNVASKTATLNFARDRLQRLNQHYANTTKTLSLSRKYSDASHDRERPFVTVKRAIATDRGRDSALAQLQSAPLGHVNYHHSATNQNDGLLTTLHQQTKVLSTCPPSCGCTSKLTYTPLSCGTSSAKLTHAPTTSSNYRTNVSSSGVTSLTARIDNVTRARNEDVTRSRNEDLIRTRVDDATRCRNGEINRTHSEDPNRSDDINRARNAYKTYLASMASNKSVPNNYDDARLFSTEKSIFRDRSLDMTTNLKKVPSFSYVNSSEASNDASRYYNMVIPNVISDALASTHSGGASNPRTYNERIIPNDLYFTSDNKVYNITGYTNSLDRGFQKKLSSLNHFRIDTAKNNHLNNSKQPHGIPYTYSTLPRDSNSIRSREASITSSRESNSMLQGETCSTLPRSLSQSHHSLAVNRLSQSKQTLSSANTSSSSGVPESSENKDSENSTSASASCTSANDFALVSAPEGFTNCPTSTSAVSPKNGEESHWQSDAEVTHHSSSSGHRPITPGFPPSTPTTPYLNQGLPPKSPTMQRKDPLGSGVHRSCSPHNGQSPHNGHSSPAPSLYHGHPSRRSSLSSLNDGTSSQDVIHSHPKFVKDISKFWYKPAISRDEAINILKAKPPGTFIVRDSNSFPGAFGLAVKVATPPPNVVVSSTGGDPANELVRHFLIEPTARGVRLKGCSNEPVFGSLSALVYQHSITALALPCRLTLPERDPAASSTTTGSSSSSTVDNNVLLQQGAACTVLYLHSLDTESLTGPQAVKRAVSSLLSSSSVRPTPVHFKVSSAGITLTDNHRTLFFRQHFPVHSISHCGTDPDDRRWQHSADSGEPIASLRMFGFVAKKGTARNQNQCHVLAELEPEQPATAICNFVTKVMMTSANRANLV